MIDFDPFKFVTALLQVKSAVTLLYKSFNRVKEGHKSANPPSVIGIQFCVTVFISWNSKSLYAETHDLRLPPWPLSFSSSSSNIAMRRFERACSLAANGSSESSSASELCAGVKGTEFGIVSVRVCGDMKVEFEPPEALCVLEGISGPGYVLEHSCILPHR